MAAHQPGDVDGPAKDPDNDPTLEEEGLPFDPDPTIVAFNADSSGIIALDDCGQPRWKWLTEEDAPPTPSDTAGDTFDFLKAIDNWELAIEDTSEGPQPAVKPAGYNPYDTAPKKK